MRAPGIAQLARAVSLIITIGSNLSSHVEKPKAKEIATYYESYIF